VGGPIKKDKMFFFTNFEGVRQNTGQVYVFTLPDAAAHLGYVPDTTGKYQCVNNGAIIYPNPSCAATIPAAIQKFLPYFPNFTDFATNQVSFQSPGIINGLGIAFEPTNSPASENYVVSRYDWTISGRDSIFVRYLYDAGSLFNAFNSPVISALAPQGWGTQDSSKNQFLSIEEKRVWANNLVSSTRFGFSRTSNQSYTYTDAGPLWQFAGNSTFGFPQPFNGAIQITSLLNANFPRVALGGGGASRIVQNKFTGGEDMYGNKGAHGLRFGVSVTRVQSNKFAPPGAGTWNFANITNFLKDIPNTYGGTCNPALFAACSGFSTAGVSPLYFFHTDVGLYFQDDWKISSTITLNVGLRYEPQSNPIALFGAATAQAALNLPFSASFDPALPMPGCLPPTAAVPVSCPALSGGATGFTPIHRVYLTNPSFHNFDPRIGIAWDPFKDHKTSVRAGYGIFHSPIPPYDYTMPFTNVPAGTAVTQSCGSTGAACSTFPIPFQSAGSFSPTQDGSLDTGNKSTPYMQQYNLTVQREVARNTIVSIGYVGSRGVHLLGLTDLNPSLPSGVPGAITVPVGKVVLPYPAIGQSLTGGTATSPGSATGAPIVDAGTGQMSYSNLMCNAGTLTGCSVVANNRVDPAIGFWNASRSTFWSVYNSLQAGVVRRLTGNLQAQISYTYASCITNSSGDGGLEGQITGEDAWNTNLDRGPCSFMIRHNFYTNGMYVLPFKGNRLISGWQLGGIFQYHTGTPFYIGTGWQSGLIDRASNVTNARPNLIPGCNQVLGTVQHWIDTSCYVQPPIGEPGNVAMNSIFGPNSMTFDGSLVKNTRISERYNVQFRAEFFNLFNRPNFRNPGQPAVPVFTQAPTLTPACATTPSACSIVNGTAGQINLTNTTSRQVQFGLKILF
jgi:hypothetical protein